MSNRIENINSEIIKWAILRTGNSLEEFYEKNQNVEKWIRGEKFPTLKQLEQFTHKVHVPFGYMFLPTPPDESIPIAFFRTGHNSSKNKVSLNVFHAIQMLQERQNWLTDYLEEIGIDDLDYVGKYSIDNNIIDIVEDIRQRLNLGTGWASDCADWQEALDKLTTSIEESGIIVTFNGIVGTNTHRVIDVDECRGFVLVNKKAPFMFINASDSKAAQMFTLIHELAHIWLGVSAGFDNAKLMPADDPIERMCDQIAAEFLVPEQRFNSAWVLNSDFKFLARIFKVSTIVIARRALDLNLINRAEFFSFYNSFMTEFKAHKEAQGSGGNFYATAKRRVSLRFAAFVNTAVKNEKLFYRDAYKLTNLKGDSYNNFVNKYL